LEANTYMVNAISDQYPIRLHPYTELMNRAHRALSHREELFVLDHFVGYDAGESAIHTKSHLDQ